MADGFLGIPTDDWDGLRGSDIVSRNPILFAGHCVEIFFDNLFSSRQSIAPAHGEIMADQSGNPVVGGMGIFPRRARSIEFGAQIYGVLKPMSTDAKVEKYEALSLGYLPIVALTIRHTIPPSSQMSQSLTLELLKGEQAVSLKFTGLRQLRLANLGSGSSCLMNISSVAQDQWEGVRYRVFNGEQDPTLSFYCVAFGFSF